MREILFRGKRVDNGEWVYGYYVKQVDAFGAVHRIYHSASDPDDSNAVYEIDKKTVGQFTGLTDKNGKKIFEGDIVKFNTETYTSIRDTIGVVGYYNSSYGIAYENNRHFLEFNNMSMYVRWYEIIGNIHDNQELLNEN